MADTALAPMEVAPRAGRVRQRLEEAGCEALLVTNLVNVRYLTGFSGSAGILLVLPDELVLVTDGRYQFQSAEQLRAAGVEARIEIGNLAGQQKAMADAARGLARRLVRQNFSVGGSFSKDRFTRRRLVRRSFSEGGRSFAKKFDL